MVSRSHIWSQRRVVSSKKRLPVFVCVFMRLYLAKEGAATARPHIFFGLYTGGFTPLFSGNKRNAVARKKKRGVVRIGMICCAVCFPQLFSKLQAFCGSFSDITLLEHWTRHCYRDRGLLTCYSFFATNRYIRRVARAGSGTGFLR